MKKTVLTYGFISGAIAVALMLAHLSFFDSLHGSKGLIVGYTGIILSSLLVFFGVRSYRENVGGGKISFGRGLAVGVQIALISATCYVATWQLIYFKFAPEFAQKCLAGPIEELKASGAEQDEINAAQTQLVEFKKLYDKPLMNALITYIEPFPVGLAMTLISAAILRRK